MSATSFRLNGETVPLAGADPTESLLRWLRRHARHGTKEGCADGDCGACTVALRERDADGKLRFTAVNSCLLPVGNLPGRDVTTVEALADGDTLHPAQQAMVECAGSQCGYCTPGFVMSLFVDWHRGQLGDDSIEGNLCRCTGYRTIREATALLAAQKPARDQFTAALAEKAVPLPDASLETFHSPTTLIDALSLKAKHPDATWIAGGTDLGVALSHGHTVAPHFIALDRIEELQTLEVFADSVRIGAGVTLTRLQRELAGLFPALDQMLPAFAARQVRNRATLGGNLGTASPIGDLLPVLLAYDASIACVGPRGARTVAADAFFSGYRQTARADDEIIVAVTLPRDTTLRSAAYKVAKRQTDDISIVAAVFALAFDGERRVTLARLAYGGVAAVPLRMPEAETFLIGKRLDDDTVRRAASLLREAVQPLDDHRASATYRADLVGNLFAKFAAEHAP